ncbi:MAG: hypothetical protein V3T86_09475 [Planctomycetota bacterium]
MTKRVTISLAIILVALVATPVRAGDPPGPYHKNDRWGFKVKSPNGWLTAAMSANEKWVASKFVGSKGLKPKDAGNTYYWEQKPDFWIIGFPHSRKGERKAEIKDGKYGQKVFTTKENYRDYKDFMKKEGIAGGGYHFTREEEIDGPEGKISIYEALMEDPTGARASKRILTWVYHFDDIDFAVQFRILDDYYKNYLKGFKGCLKSFRRIKRKRALPGAETTGRKIKDKDDETGMTTEEKKQSRQEEMEGRIAREKDVLGKGWYMARSKNYVAFSNTTRKYTKRILNHCEAVRAYLAKELGEVGSDYVPPGIVRVFQNYDAQRAYSQGSKSLWSGASPILVAKRQGGSFGYEFDGLSSSITSQWLSYKNTALSNSMPPWLRYGLTQYLRMGRSKGKKLEFKLDGWDRTRLRALLKSGRAAPIKKMFLRDTEGMDVYTQSGSVVWYLLTKGNRGAFKGALRNYLQNLIVSIETAQAELEAEREKQLAKLEAAKAGEAGESDEDEDEDEEGGDEEASAAEEFSQAMIDAFKKRSKKIYEDSFNATFSEITDKQWDRLDRAWYAWAK